MGAYISSAGTVVQKFNIADQETILISSIIGSSLYIAFILLLLFLFTFPTLRFFSTASTCCRRGSSGDDGSQSQCCSWKNPCEGYLKKLDEKLLGNAPKSSEQQTANMNISLGSNPSGHTTEIREKEAEKQKIKESDGASSSNANCRGKAPATGNDRDA